MIAAGGDEGRRADDLVGRHGLDRRLPRSVQLLRPDPGLRAARCRAAGTGRGTATRISTTKAAEADSIVDPGQGRASATRCGATSTPRSWRTRPGRRSSTSSASPCSRARMGGADNLYRRPGPHPDQLRLRVRQRCAVTATTRSTARHHHFGWDNSISPRPSGWRPARPSSSSASTSSGGQLHAGQHGRRRRRRSTSPRSIRSPARSIVEGAEPGDALKVTIEEFKPSGFGWTANIPGFGLLADHFKEPALNTLEVRRGYAARRRCSARTAACR